MYGFLFWAALLCAVALFALLGAGTLLKAGGDLTLRQWHHGYLGAALFLIGLLLRLLLGPGAWAAGFQVGGLALLEDDALEHGTQALTGQFTYQSPLHAIFYALFGRLGWVRAAGAALDAGAAKL